MRGYWLLVGILLVGLVGLVVPVNAEIIDYSDNLVEISNWDWGAWADNDDGFITGNISYEIVSGVNGHNGIKWIFTPMNEAGIWAEYQVPSFSETEVYFDDIAQNITGLSFYYKIENIDDTQESAFLYAETDLFYTADSNGEKYPLYYFYHNKEPVNDPSLTDWTCVELFNITDFGDFRNRILISHDVEYGYNLTILFSDLKFYTNGSLPEATPTPTPTSIITPSPYNGFCDNQTGNVTLSLASSSLTSLGWQWNESIILLSFDNWIQSTFDNTSQSVIFNTLLPGTRHLIKIYNGTEYGAMNCTTNSTPPAPYVPVMNPSTDTSATGVLSYWWVGALLVGLVVVFKKW